MTYGLVFTFMLATVVGLLIGNGITSLWYQRRGCQLEPARLRVIVRPSRIDWERLDDARDPSRLPIGTKVVRKP